MDGGRGEDRGLVVVVRSSTSTPDSDLYDDEVNDGCGEGRWGRYGLFWS